MCKRPILLTLVVLVLLSGNIARAGVEYKVDLARVQYEDTKKPGWIIWAGWADGDYHDIRTYNDLGGSGIQVRLSQGKEGGGALGRSIDGSEAICNTYYYGYYEWGGWHSDVLLGFYNIPAGGYKLYGYHRHPSGYAPMPRIDVNCVGASVDQMTEPAKWGVDPLWYEPNDPNYPILVAECAASVVQIHDGETNDVNIGILTDTMYDANLVPSLVKFYTDGTPVLVRYVCGGDSAVLNAFILESLAPPPEAYDPSPASTSSLVCPDAELSWAPGAHANDVGGHHLYFGTDFNDVNDASTTVYIGRLDDPCHDPAGYLDFGQTYYWRVDEANDSCSPHLWEGPVWSFTAEYGKARNPSPPDGGWSVEDNYVDWTPSCLATSHDFYWDTNFADVNSGTTPLIPGVPEVPEVHPLELGSWVESGTRYYWRMDEKGPVTFPKGDVWSYTTRGAALIHYEFDGVIDDNLPDPIVDSTGHVSFGRVTGTGGGGSSKYAEPNPLYNTLGTSARFLVVPEGEEATDKAGLSREAYGTDILDLDIDSYTIEAWFKQESPAAAVVEDDLAATLFRRYDRSYILAIGDDGAVRFAHSGDDNIIATEPGTIQLDEWYHVAAVFDSCDPCNPQKIYVSGIVLGGGGTTDLNPSNDDEPVGIGARTNSWDVDVPRVRNRFNGSIDELRVSDYALTPGEFLLRGDKGLAWLPRPYNGQSNVAPDVNFIWSPGEHASSHDVYLGTSWDDVNDAITLDSEWKGNTGPNTFDPGFLTMKTTLYWRVDEVNDSNGYVWKGHVWQFTTADFINLDDFESYHPTENRIYYNWIDQRSQPWGEATGSWLGLARAPSLPVNDGEQAMQYEYNTNDPWADVYYAEAWLPLDITGRLQDWTLEDLRMLTLFFYGDAENDVNDTEQMYVSVEDTAGNYAEMRYGDNPGESPSDLLVEEWQEWNIPLTYFTDSNFAEVPNDVNFASVERVYIGFGNRRSPQAAGSGVVYFDDLRVSLPTCVPDELKPAYDFSGNCIVDIEDVGIMGEQWLRSDVNVNPVTVPSDANLVAHWELDGDANDSSANAYHGAAQGSYAWVAGREDQAIELSGGWVVVEDSGNTPELRPKHYVSAMAWVYIENAGEDSKVVIKGENDEETFGLEVDSDNGAAFLFRDANDPADSISVNCGYQLQSNEWIHIAGTYDNNDQLIYVNGVEEGSETPGAIELFTDPNDGLGIGGRYGDGADFDGKIDDVRVYDRAVTRAEIAYIASGGDGVITLESEVNIYDGESPEIINLKDFATLMESWLEERLWPE